MENNCTALINFIRSNEQEFYIFELFIDSYTKEVKDLQKKLKNDNELKAFLYSILDIKDKEVLEEKLNLFYAIKVNKNLTFKDIIEIKVHKDNKISIQFIQDKFKYFSENSFISEFNLDIIQISKEFIESAFYFDNDLEEIMENYYPKMIVAFIMHFETFFNKLLKFITGKNEYFLLEKLQNEKEPTLTYKEILANPTVDWKEYIIDMQLNKLTRNMIHSIEQIIKTTKNTEFIKKNFPDLEKDFKEIYYRRNLIVHNNSIVNEVYINNTGVTNIDKGQKLETKEDYVSESLTTCNKFACLLYAILGKRLKKEDQTDYYMILDDYAYYLLRKGIWKEALFIYTLLLEFNAIDNEKELNYTFNIYNCQKHLNDFSYQKKLKERDFTAYDVVHKIAKHLLLDENEQVYELLMEHYPHNINEYEILEWAIFMDFRKTEEFLKFKFEKLTNLNSKCPIEIQN